MIPACYEIGFWIDDGDPKHVAGTHASALTAGAPRTRPERAESACQWTTAQLDLRPPGERVSWLRIHEYVRGVRDGLRMAARGGQ